MFELDISNKKHQELLKKYEEENDKINIQKRYDKSSNEQNIYLCFEKDDMITDVVLIQCMKDVKSCMITYLKKNKKNKDVILSSTNYALNTLGMEEAFINIEKSDKKIMAFLEKMNYESLGEENGYMLYLKEKSEILIRERII